ncbi:MAG: mandelate racemase/muconate lactonizing enzyme family protein [Syntrophorhabdales bacterium]|jgi:L-alanine-DL-glutamate epimerase-like enolase superfamily enzyme
MKIIGIEMFPVSIAFRRKVKTAFRGFARDEGVSEENVVVKIYTDEGVSGLGEAGTWGIYYIGEGQESIMAAIGTYLFRDVLKGESPFNVDLIHRKMDEAVLGNTVAKSAIDFALYDIMGKVLNAPVCQLIGGSYADKYPTNAAVLGIDTPEVMAKIAKDSLKGLGPEPRMMKVKLGLEYLKDVKRVEAIREAIGPDHYLLLDCNGSLQVKEAIHFGQKVERFAPVFLEQPVDYDDLEGLAEVKRNVPVPVGACECALTIEQMMRVIRMDAADFFNFKIDRLGGIYKGKQAAGMINAANKWILLSGQVSVGIAATARNHFAAATCNMFRPVASGVSGVFSIYPASYPEYKQVENVLTGLIKVEKGYAAAPHGPGLGIELNEKALREFLTKGKSRVLVGKKG